MNKGFALVLSLFGACAIFALSSGRAEAAKYFTGASTDPSSYRALCNAGTPVDFAAYPSNVNLDVNSGVMTYDINVQWRRCNSTETRAYAIYDGQDICPLAGYYGAGPAPGYAYDCVKYIGSPAYSGAGNGLACPGGNTNANCVTSSFTGARRVANQPSSTPESITIPMSSVNGLWAFVPDTPNSWTISNTLCQYYKTGASFNTHNANSRCMTISITVNWTNVPPTPAPTCELTANPSSIAASGTSTLSWTATNAASASINNGVGPVSAPGSTTVSPAISTSYTMTVTGVGGSNTCSVTISVSPACSANPSTARVNQVVTLTGSGGNGSYSWSMPGGDPSSGSGVTRTTRYAAAGSYTVTVTSGGQSATCTVRVANRPYFKVFRGDAASCGTILGFNRGSGGSYGGASTQLAAIALGIIDGFASASTRTSAPTRPIGLTLANTGVPGSYGGSFSTDVADLPCPKHQDMSTPTGTFTPSTSYSGQETIVHNGDLYIGGNLQYIAWNTNNVAAIPSLTVVVNGNIYIDDSVTRLDGVYIAQENGPNTGQIFTCAESAPNNLHDADDLETQCDTKLTFNGSVIAKKIHLLRTNGDVRTATGSEQSGSGNIAEVFNYSPAVWLTPVCNPSCSPTATDAIYALPPIP